MSNKKVVSPGPPFPLDLIWFHWFHRGFSQGWEHSFHQSNTQKPSVILVTSIILITETRRAGNVFSGSVMGKIPRRPSDPKWKTVPKGSHKVHFDYKAANQDLRKNKPTTVIWDQVFLPSLFQHLFFSVSSANKITFGEETDLQTHRTSIWIHGHTKERFCSSTHTHTHKSCTENA